MHTEQLHKEIEPEPETTMLGDSPCFKSIYQQLIMLAKEDSPILICGETGTGKNLCTEFIHSRSKSSTRDLVTCFCAGMSVETLRKELLTPENHNALINSAAGGTLLLDAIDAFPLTLQADLTQLIQEKTRATDSTTRIRFIATSNRDLRQMVMDGKMAPELHQLLRENRVKLPPLRERKEDIPLLAKHFAGRYGAGHYNTTTAQLRQLQNYDWPGNVRELENKIMREVILAQKTENQLH